jgi:hypothetical protein
MKNHKAVIFYLTNETEDILKKIIHIEAEKVDFHKAPSIRSIMNEGIEVLYEKRLQEDDAYQD